MSVLLRRAYATYAAGETVNLDNETEATLVAQSFGSYVVNPGSAFFPLTAAEQQNLRDSGVTTSGRGSLTVIDAAIVQTLTGGGATRRPLIRSFTYTGTGAIQEVVVGFQPDLLIFKDVSTGAIISVLQHPANWYGRAPYLGFADGHVVGGNGMTRQGFMVGVANFLNTAATVYSCLAIADNGSGKLRVGDYAGNGVDGRSLAEIIGQDANASDLVFFWVGRDNTTERWFRGKNTNEACTMTANNGSATVISSLIPLTISNSADVNTAVTDAAAGGHYSWFALYDCSDWYTAIEPGTGVARDISLPFSLKDKLSFAMLRRLAVTANNRSPQVYIPEASINTSFRPAEATFNATMINGNASKSISVGAGNEVNSSTFNYFLLAMREQLLGADSQIIHPTYLGRAGLKVTAAAGGVLTQYLPPVTAGSAFAVEALVSLSSALEVAVWAIASAAAVRSVAITTSDFTTPVTNYPVYKFKAYDGTERNRDGGMRIADQSLAHLVFFSDGAGNVGMTLNGRFREQLTSSATITAPTGTKMTMLSCRDTGDVLTQSAVGSTFGFFRFYGFKPTNAQMYAMYLAAIGAPGGAVPTYAEEWDAANVTGNVLRATVDRAHDGEIRSMTATTI